MATNVLTFPTRKPAMPALVFAGKPCTTWVELEIPAGLLPPGAKQGNYFLVPIVENGLAGDGIFDGDHVLVRRPFEGEQPKQGEIVAVTTPTGLMVLRFYRTLLGLIRLASSHEDQRKYKDFYFKAKRITIEGIFLHRFSSDEIKHAESY